MYRRTAPAHVVFDDPAQPAARAVGGNLRGSTLLEVLVALGIVAVTLTVVVSMLVMGVRAVGNVDEQTVATTLARSQMESVKSAAWPGPYSPVAAPAGFTIQITTAPGPSASIQVVTVRVQRDGREILRVDGYKGQR
jgi:Tfp pilus assembly protein PilV